MKILLLTQYYWPENFLINSLVPLLSARDVEVIVLTGKPNYPDGKIFQGYRASGVQCEQHEGINVNRLPILPRGQNSKIRLALNYISFISAGFLLGRHVVRRCEYDLVFVYAPSPLLQALPAIWLARSRNVPLIVWVQDLWPESLSATGHLKIRWLLKMLASVVRLIYHASDRVLVQSRAFVAPVAALCDDVNKIYYYPNLYQASTEQQVSHSAEELIKTLKTHFNVVFTGNLGAAQSLDTILEAARLLMPHNNIRIVLVGSGSLDQWLARQRDTLGLTNLVLAGRFLASDMTSIFDAADALLVTLKPEPAFRLTVPSKVQAYLAAGRPILAALDGEGARIIQEAGAGLCSSAGDGKELAKNVMHLMAMSPLARKHMGDNGRSYFAKHYSPELLADKLVEHFSEILCRKEK